MPQARLKIAPSSTLYRRWAVWLCLLILPLSATAEIYKWVDASGRVHFSDKKHADERAKRVDEPPEDEAISQNRLTFYPDADTLLSQNKNTAQGNTHALSAGNWSVGGTSVQHTSLLRFDLTELLSVVNGDAGKRIASAKLYLYANTDDKLYGQEVSNKEPPGHSTLKGSNAFYLIPSHNSWEESKATWSDYYSNSHYTPSTIRSLPSVTVEASSSATEDYEVDVNELMSRIAKNNIRELTLEMKLQRLPPMAQVTFYSKEAAAEKRPRMVIELVDPPKP